MYALAVATNGTDVFAGGAFTKANGNTDRGFLAAFLARTGS